MREEASCEWGQNWSTLFLLYFVPNEVPVQCLWSPTVDPFQHLHTVGRWCCSNLTLRIEWWEGNLEHQLPYLHVVGWFFLSQQWTARFIKLCKLSLTHSHTHNRLMSAGPLSIMNTQGWRYGITKSQRGQNKVRYHSNVLTNRTSVRRRQGGFDLMAIADGAGRITNSHWFYWLEV